jgi:hypothetical protein
MGRFGGFTGSGNPYKPKRPQINVGNQFKLPNVFSACVLGCVAMVAIVCLCGLIFGAQVLSFFSANLTPVRTWLSLTARCISAQAARKVERFFR